MVIHLMQEVDVLLRNHCVLLSVNDKGRTPNPVHLEEPLSNMVDLSLVSLETEGLEIGFGYLKQFFLKIIKVDLATADLSPLLPDLDISTAPG